MMENVLPSRNVRELTWIREDRRATAFRTTLSGGPKWQTVRRRVTEDATTGTIIEDTPVDPSADIHYHAIIPEGP